MKKILMTLAAVLCCATLMSLFSACTKEEVIGDTTYNFGFDSYSSASNNFLADITLIDNTFKNAFKQELGVTPGNGYFIYNGGDDKVKAACEKAAAVLKEKAIPGSFVYVVTKTNAKGTSTVYTWKQ